MATFPARDGVRLWPVRSADERRPVEVRAPATARPLEVESGLLQPDSDQLSGLWEAFVSVVFVMHVDSGLADCRQRDEATSEPHGGFVLD